MCNDYIRYIKLTQSLKKISPAFHQIVSRGNGNIQLVVLQEIKKLDVALLDQRRKYMKFWMADGQIDPNDDNGY